MSNSATPESAAPSVVLKFLAGRFCIHRLPPGADIPSSALAGSFYWIGKTDEELSLVCDEAVDGVGGESSANWACLKVLGPIDFSVTGLLAGLAAVLAAEKISIFALSTFDTDYILVPGDRKAKAKEALVEAGYGFEGTLAGTP